MFHIVPCGYVKTSRLLLFIVACLTYNFSYADYKVSGRVNLSEEWQPQIFLAAINKLDDYYNAYPDLIVDAANINPDGTFLLQGSTLPPEKKFYRIYLMKEQNSEFDACFYGGDDHNFIHVVLHNNMELLINSDATEIAPFGNYTIKGDHDNDMMQSLASLVYPTFYFHQIKFPSELRFSQEKFNRDLISFSDTCTSTMASLAAVINTDMDKYHQSNSAFYSAFATRLDNDLRDNSYTQDYERKLRYYYSELKTKSSWKEWSLILLSGICLFLIWQNMQLRKKPDLSNKQAELKQDPTEQLTKKEKEILNLITEGKSNKEIASVLFVELSTVKTHINKIYSKLNISQRKEAIKIGQSLIL